MKVSTIASLFILTLSMATPALSWASDDNPVHSLAQGCYAIQSPQTGKFVHRYTSGGLVNDGQSFGLFDASLATAGRFYFKPTGLDHYMMTDSEGYYLAARLPYHITAGTYAGKFAEWRTNAVPQPDGSYRYRFTVTGLNRTLRHNYSSDSLYFVDELNPYNYTSETDFILVPQTDCTPFPEIQTNVTGNLDALKSDASQPVRGFVDPHTHITSYEFMGGRFMHGKPFHRFGVASALNDSSGVHGSWGALDIIGNLMAYNDVNYRYDTRGWPDFPHWPNYKQMSHMGYYYKWLERAYLGGQRMIVTHIVENEVLCNLQSSVNPAAWVGHNSCNTMDSIRLQIQRLKEMQTYIDAQAGGIGRGFFRIVTSPEQARAVIADGKLAVLMGIEASETFNCGLKDNCDRADVERQLQEIYDLGVRVLYPTHKFDNRFGGSRVEDGLINVGQVLSTGYAFDTQECDADTHGPAMTSGFPLLGSIPVIGDIANSIVNPQYQPDIEHCNQQGLSDLGVYLVNRMIDKKMLIELDHMSEKTASSVLAIAEARQYSGVISSHSWMTQGKNGELHNNLKRAVQLGGFVTPYNWTATEVAKTIGQYLDEVEQTPYVHGVSFATDMSGLGNQPGPREDADIHPLRYPFTTEFGLVIDKQQSGNRTYNYNLDGMAHYGMVADHLEDIRQQAPARIYEAVMHSAEAYLQMWERAEANRSSDYYDPLPTYVRIVNWSSGKCLDIPGDDNNLFNGQKVLQYSCQHHSDDQQWIYDKAAQTLRSRVDPNMCLDNRDQAYNNGNIGISFCDGSLSQRWFYDGYWLRADKDRNYVIDVWGNSNNDFIGSWQFDGSNSQAWELRTEKTLYTWSTLRTHQSGRCLDIPYGDLTNGNTLLLDRCHGGNNQQWYYEPKQGTLHSKLNWNKCVTLLNGNTANDTPIVIADCNNSASQQWNNDGGYFRSHLNPNKVIDANGSGDRSEISIWDYHGGSNQRWRNVIN
ncbi:ricin-type beta-trefoil lectin domain protein [Shewanella halotolerans]|uniref:ricin-type beta-trefoil lectin domain protein n=1 Tax=Shewanella halotolerans TaxID=2864204 RepID=UPI001C65CE18|nr:ricin-type beta-trefoil lectin domain protein [Shewanella halotolerans]QYJ91478.1 ricin-type beta-trefoil lectin domain protein [Shewanella halotolerans]